MNKKFTKVLGISTVAGLALSTVISAANVQAAPANVDRLEGNDRYETAANVAKANWTAGETENVILVSGHGYADALSASLLAQKLNAPILLTETDKLNKNAYEAINKLAAKNVYVLGSQGVLSDNIKNSLEKQGKKVTRLGGRNRYETNIAIANELVTNHKVKADEVLVVNGNKYLADALTAAPVAAKEEKILLLVGEDGTSSKEVRKFVNNHKSKVTVIGGTVTVPNEIYNELGATKRVNGGKDRYETNRLILEAFDVKGTYVCVANGKTDHLVDSLVASALAGKYKSPMVLVSNNEETDSKIIDYMKNKLKINNESKLAVLGGKNVLPEKIVEKINRVRVLTKATDDKITKKENDVKNPVPAPINSVPAPINPVPAPVNPVPAPINPVPAPVVKDSKVEIKSEIARHGVRGILGVEQKGHVKIEVFANDGILQNDKDITIAGRTVKVHKGDNSPAIKDKIINAFKDDKDWLAENIFIVEQGNKPVRVTFTRKACEKNEDKLGIDNTEIRFTQQDEAYGREVISEVSEICNVIVTSVSNKQETINVNVTGEKQPVLNQTVTVNVKPTDTTKDVAKSIYNAFQANDTLKAVYNIVLDEQNSKIVLTQKLGDLIDTVVTIK